MFWIVVAVKYPCALPFLLLAKCIGRVAGIELIRGEPKQGGEYMRELRQWNENLSSLKFGIWGWWLMEV